jgi:hypothetical protein
MDHTGLSGVSAWVPLATLILMQGEPTPWIRGAAALVGVEALSLLVFATAALFTIDSDRIVLGATNAAFFFVYGLGLGLCARGLARLRSWCRGPIVLAQIIQLGIAWSFAGQGTVWLSVALTVPALLVLACVLAPSTTHALYGANPVDGG